MKFYEEQEAERVDEINDTRFFLHELGNIEKRFRPIFDRVVSSELYGIEPH